MNFIHWISLIVVLQLANATSCTRVVQLPNGSLQGTSIENYYSFTNVRYAEPPTRFEPAMPLMTQWNGTYNATGEMLLCVQFDEFSNLSRGQEGQEDCLFLNIFTPMGNTSRKLLPVFVYIHGGAFMYGGARFYSPKVIMESNSMVLVSINYRLGPLGFLKTEGNVIPENLGLKDQKLALQWIKKNIHNFGGDPEKILLTGHSAGGASVHLHVLNKETEDLVTAAVAISGSALNPWVMQKNVKEKTKTLAGHLNCSYAIGDGDQLKKCLQKQPIEEITVAVSKMYKFLDNPFNFFGPTVEDENIPGAFLTTEPRRLIESGQIANVPFMLTMTTEEGAYNAGSLLRKDENGVEYIEVLNERWVELAPYLLFYYDDPCDSCKSLLSESLRQMYMNNERFSQTSYLKLQKMFSDVLFINGILETIKLHRKFGSSPVYGYVYANSHNYGVGNFLSQNSEFEFGAAHWDDVELFLPSGFSTNYTAKANDHKIAKYLVNMFETFAIDGKPRFRNVHLKANRNTRIPTEFLQIFENSFCLSPWTGAEDSSKQGFPYLEKCFAY